MPFSESQETFIVSGERDIVPREKSEKLKFAKVAESENLKN